MFQELYQYSGWSAMPKSTTATTIRFDADFLAELQVAIIRRRVPSMKDLVTELLRKWMDDPAQDWQTLKNMVQETAAAPDFINSMREAVNSAVKESLAFTMVELKSDKLPLSGSGESATGEIDTLWHEMLDRILASGHPKAQRAVIQSIFTIGELADLIAQGKPDAKNNPADHRLPENKPKRPRKIA